MKRFCESLREHAMEIINFEKKKMKLLTKEHQESYETLKSVIFVNKNLKINMWKIKNIVKLEYRGPAHRICSPVYLKKFL